MLSQYYKSGFFSFIIMFPTSAHRERPNTHTHTKTSMSNFHAHCEFGQRGVWVFLPETVSLKNFYGLNENKFTI